MKDDETPFGHALSCAKWQQRIEGGKRALILDASMLCTCGAMMSEEERNPNYITMLPTMNPNTRLVVVMHYDKADDSYHANKFSQPLNEKNAKALAESWSQALKLEIR